MLSTWDVYVAATIQWKRRGTYLNLIHIRRSNVIWQGSWHETHRLLVLQKVERQKLAALCFYQSFVRRAIITAVAINATTMCSLDLRLLCRSLQGSSEQILITLCPKKRSQNNCSSDGSANWLLYHMGCINVCTHLHCILVKMSNCWGPIKARQTEPT